MLLRSASTGAFQVYDIVNDNITNSASLGAVGLDFQLAGFGDFDRDGGSDMILRNRNTGEFEAYDIRNNAIASAVSLGTVGLNFQVAGFGDFNADGTTDMMLRLGTIGLDWSVGGFAVDAPTGAGGFAGGANDQLVQAMAGFGGGDAADDLNGALLSSDISQPLLTMPQQG